jgi:hypothetical protein
VPNCYYLVGSTPEQTGADAVDCGRQYGGQTRLIGKGRKSRRFHVLVLFRRLEDALEALEPIKECLEKQGHSVDPGYEVIEDVTELGVSVEGYEPYPGPEDTAS